MIQYNQGAQQKDSDPRFVNDNDSITLVLVTPAFALVEFLASSSYRCHWQTERRDRVSMGMKLVTLRQGMEGVGRRTY